MKSTTLIDYVLLFLVCLVLGAVAESFIEFLLGVWP